MTTLTLDARNMPCPPPVLRTQAAGARGRNVDCLAVFLLRPYAPHLARLLRFPAFHCTNFSAESSPFFSYLCSSFKKGRRWL